MKILVACEESQAVAIAFRKRGFAAFSCDIDNCSGGHPDWHIRGDAIKEAYSGKYDAMIAHPPCTYLCNSGVQYLHKRVGRWDALNKGVSFFVALLNAPIDHIAVENPIPHKYAVERIGRKYDQIIQPWQFGEDASKATCFWLKGFPKLIPTKIIKKDRYANQTPSGCCKLSPGPERSRLRSKTFKGVADAMAEQWGAYLNGDIIIPIQEKLPL